MSNLGGTWDDSIRTFNWVRDVYNAMSILPAPTLPAPHPQLSLELQRCQQLLQQQQQVIHKLQHLLPRLIQQEQQLLKDRIRVLNAELTEGKQRREAIEQELGAARTWIAGRGVEQNEQSEILRRRLFGQLIMIKELQDELEIAQTSASFSEFAWKDIERRARKLSCRPMLDDGCVDELHIEDES